MGFSESAETTKPVRVFQRKWIIWMSLLVVLVMVAFAVFLGGLAGYRDATVAYQKAGATQRATSLLDQYVLGVQDLNAGEYDLAQQRFEYVLERDPSFPGAAEMLAEAMQVLFATATPTPVPPTQTPTPTPDLRPIEELFTQATASLSEGNFDATIDACVALRMNDPEYRVVEVDRLLYLAFRNRGLSKIREQSNLEGGIFDLTLAERFGPLDSESTSYRNLARLYMVGSGFWEVYPAQAVYYFGQVAAAAPYLRDSSGWTARERYRGALLQYGDQLAREGDWCAAEVQYSLAFEIRGDDAVSATITNAAYECAPPTPEPSPTFETASPTFTLTSTIAPPTATSEVPMRTPTPGMTSTPTPTPVPSDTPGVTTSPPPSPTPVESINTPTDTVTPPTGTPTPTETVISEADTPTPSLTTTATATISPTVLMTPRGTPRIENLLIERFNLRDETL